MNYGKTIELFLVNGTADSLIIAELSNWNGKAIKIPRIEVSTCNREDLSQAGVYFLFCKEDDGKDSVYIGEAENVKERLVQHLRDYQSEQEKYYWNTAVVFIGRDLTKAHIRYLENQLVDKARSAHRYDILTKNTYKNTVMKESQIAAMNEYVDNVQIIINALGYKVLEAYTAINTRQSIDDDILHVSIGDCEATGKVTAEGFVLFKGSTINVKSSAKSLSTGMLKLREKLVSEKKVVDRKIVEDILFTSSSAAADFVLGYSVSGPKTWKRKDGVSLKEIESKDL